MRILTCVIIALFGLNLPLVANSNYRIETSEYNSNGLNLISEGELKPNDFYITESDDVGEMTNVYFNSKKEKSLFMSLINDFKRSTKYFLKKYGVNQLYDVEDLKNRIAFGIKTSLEFKTFIEKEKFSIFHRYKGKEIEIDSTGTIVRLEILDEDYRHVFDGIISKAKELDVKDGSDLDIKIHFRDKSSLVFSYGNASSLESYYLIRDKSLNYLLSFHGSRGCDVSFDILRFYQSMRSIRIESLNPYSTDFVKTHFNRYSSVEELHSGYPNLFKVSKLSIGRRNVSGIIDRSGKIIVPVSYYDVKPIGETYICIDRNTHFSLLSKDGQVILPAIYSEIANEGAGHLKDNLRNDITNEGTGDLKIYQTDSVRQTRVGLFCLKGQAWVLPVEYENYDRIEKDTSLFVVRKKILNPDNYSTYVLLKGVVNDHNKVIIPLLYKRLSYNTPHEIFICLLVNNDGSERFGAFHKDGSIAIPFEYEGMGGAWSKYVEFRKGRNTYTVKQIYKMMSN